MCLPDIRSVVPHSGRMLLLDRIVASDADTLTAEVTVRADSLFLDGGGVGAWVGVEYMAQTVAAFAGREALRHGRQMQPGVLLGTRRFTSNRPLFPLGCTLRVTARRDTTDDRGLSSFTCSIEGDGITAEAVVTVLHGDHARGLLKGDVA
jgi:predicted hotdog family 3-hydroxylacyl-ACP dehydratase